VVLVITAIEDMCLCVAEKNGFENEYTSSLVSKPHDPIGDDFGNQVRCVLKQNLN